VSFNVASKTTAVRANVANLLLAVSIRAARPASVTFR
jgi:hypothetical protein